MQNRHHHIISRIGLSLCHSSNGIISSTATTCLNGSHLQRCHFSLIGCRPVSKGFHNGNFHHDGGDVSIRMPSTSTPYSSFSKNLRISSRRLHGGGNSCSVGTITSTNNMGVRNYTTLGNSSRRENYNNNRNYGYNNNTTTHTQHHSSSSNTSIHYLLIIPALLFSSLFFLETYRRFNGMFVASAGDVLYCDDTAFLDHRSDDTLPPNQAAQAQAEHFERIPIYRIALTGGPCAGKSTAMETLRLRLNSLGFQVLTLPEIATMFIGSGVKFPQFGPMTSDQILELQSCMVRAQMALEDVYYRLAKSTGEPTLILCDRGVIDGRAYMTPLEFQVMLDTNDWNLMQLRDQRYDCVIHMVSAAIGAESFYTLENNKARSESLYQAQMIDKKLREVYIGHPYLFVVNNQTGFEEKIEKVVNIVASIIGMPKKIGSRRKFLLKDDFKDTLISVPFEAIDVEHVFLQSEDPNEQRGIRKRTHQYVNSYSIVHKVKSMDGREETNVFRRLTPKTYMQFMKQADPSKRKIKKEQKSFVWGEHYYVLNRYKLKKNNDVNVLVVEARPDETAESLIPDFIKENVVCEVTPNEGEEDRYGLHHFAQTDRL